ncbi:hypothetical protein Droror1_Dr00021659 [Drosera rotundifolia]
MFQHHTSRLNPNNKIKLVLSLFSCSTQLVIIDNNDHPFYFLTSSTISTSFNIIKPVLRSLPPKEMVLRLNIHGFVLHHLFETPTPTICSKLLHLTVTLNLKQQAIKSKK